MKPLVLTIEDQPDIRRLIRMALEFKGYRVIEAGSGPEGLRLARSERPDLVLLDVMMPGTDGLTVSREMAADRELAALPVIMISALGTPDDQAAGLATGARAYLVKPFSPFELLALVRTLTATETDDA